MPTSLKFLGGAGTVTGSKFLFETDSGPDAERVLIDCGLFQGLKDLRLQNREKLPVDPASIDAVVLTHAHLDHTGYLPLLVRNGFKGKIHATRPTRELAKIILLDSAKIQEEDADYANKMGYSKHVPAEPLYTTKDVQAALKLFVTDDVGKWIKVTERVKFRYTPSGHILGSAFVELKFRGMRVVFSGDLGRRSPLMLPPPSRVTGADYLVVESTYGDRIHPTEAPLHRLRRIINDTIDRGGHVIIPCFAVGRVQDILYLISRLKQQKGIPDIPVFLDSPMGIHATEVLLDNPQWHKLKPKEVKELCDKVIMVQKHQQSEELSRSTTSAIVIAGSGMLTGGRVLHHLERRLPDERNTVVLAGFQAAGTRGRLLRDGIPELKMFGHYVPVKARIEEISSLSAHADQAETIAWLKGFRTAPRQTFIVHGEPPASDALRVRIQDALGWDVQIPAQFQSVELRDSGDRDSE
ncbi:MAG: MBL fold metallo-hydrolase [Deltaproteobacteria bacterium]|nr:MBL fold metallo-hydrolase [Deltaproteobacteria bacterium]